jgi:hypothetical protein
MTTPHQELISRALELAIFFAAAADLALLLFSL